MLQRGRRCVKEEKGKRASKRACFFKEKCFKEGEGGREGGREGGGGGGPNRGEERVPREGVVNKIFLIVIHHGHG